MKLVKLDIELPRQDSEGNYYISYSQFSSFISEDGFNTGLPGWSEYILSYFMGKSWPDQGWAEFGSQVEDYICERKHIEFFSEEEMKTMNSIEPLGNFQVEVKLWLAANLYLLGYIDDAKKDLSKLRDYKTASISSKDKYSKKDYYQLDLYSMWVKQETGEYPKEVEVCVIQRKGSCFGLVNRRDLLSVGENVWYIPRELSEERMEKIKTDLMRVIFEISDLYKVFKKVRGL